MKRRIVRRGVATACALVSCANAAAQATGATAAATTQPVSTMASMLQGMLGLAVVVALILAAGWALRKLGPRARSGGLVQVVGGASVGPREKVVVVRFGDRTLLLGVASGQVSLLHAVEPDDAGTGAPAMPPATPRFIDRLRTARGEA